MCMYPSIEYPYPLFDRRNMFCSGTAEGRSSASRSIGEVQRRGADGAGGVDGSGPVGDGDDEPRGEDRRD